MGDVVFVSHTSDMATWPESQSFVQAAITAVNTAVRAPVDMAYFTAREGKPADYCQQRVRASNVYVGLIGLRYGSIVPGMDISYTELEFAEATAAGMPRLVFLLDEDAPLPRRLIDTDPARIDDFRRRLQGAAGVVTRTFTSADELRLGVYQALVELAADTGAAPGATAAGGGDDPLARCRQAYLDRVVARYRRLELEVLTPAEHEDHLPVLLQSVFVPQSVRADPPPVELPKELWRRLVDAGEIGPEDLPEGLDAER